MPRVVIGHVQAEVAAGDRVVDVCDELRAAVPFSCRDGNCATCAVEVVRGDGLLVAADDHERATMQHEGVPTGCRLACRIRVAHGDGVIELRALVRQV